MTNKITSMLSRLAAPFLKPSLALLAACIVGGAWAWTDIDWTGNSESTVKYWDDTANWNNYNTSITSDGAWRILKSASITFRGNDGPSLQTWIAGGVGDNRAVFSATEDSYGFDLKDGWFCVGTWNDGELTISNGTHQVAWDLHVGYAAGWDASCTGVFTLKGGTFRTGYWLGVGEAKTGYTSTGKIFVEDGSLVVGYRNGALASGDARLNVGVSANSTGVIVQTGGTVSSSADGTGNAGDSAMAIGVEASSSGIYTISNGTYTARSGKVQIAVGTGSTGTLNVHGGVFSTSAIESGAGTATISLDGGTLSASAGGTFISSGITMTVGSNGGTIDVGANNVMIAATVTGTGAIIKKGSGTLTFTGNMSGFTGSIINTEGGVVMLPTGAAATAGVGTSKTDDGSNAIFASTAYVWTGAANDGGKWNTPGNWAIAGVAQTENYPNSDGAVVLFSENDSVVLTGNVTAGTICLADKATISGEYTISFALITNLNTEAILDITNVKLRNISSAGCIYADVKVSGDRTSFVLGEKKNAWDMHLYGGLYGAGTLTVDHGLGNSQGVADIGLKMYGNNMQFCGTIDDVNYYARSHTGFKSYISSSSNAIWRVTGKANKSTTNSWFPSMDDVYKYFGAVEGTMWLSSGTKIEIGARNDANSILYPRCHTSYTGYTIRKVGSESVLNLKYADSDNSKTKVASLEITDGTVAIDYELVPSSIFFTGKGGTLKYCAGIEDETPIYRDISGVISASTAPVSFDTDGGNYVWNTPLTVQKVSSGLTKRGNGTLTLASGSIWGGETIVKGGTLILPDNVTSIDGLVLDGGAISANGLASYGDLTINSGTLNVDKSSTIGTLTIAQGASLVLTASAGATITVTGFSDGETTKSRIMTPSGMELSWDGNVGTIVRNAHVYTWTDATGDHAWETLGNWTIPVNDVAAVPGMLPSEIDTAYFGGTCEVVLSADQPIKGLTVAEGATLTLTGNDMFGLTSLQEVPSGGLLVLNGSGLASYPIPVEQSHVDWGLNIEVAAETSNWITPTAAASDNGAGCYIVYGGNLTGSGTILLGKIGDTTRSSVTLSGDNTEFSGVATIQAGASSRGRSTFESENSASAKARWIVNGYDKNGAARCGGTIVKNGVLRFGSYEGTSYVAGIGASGIDISGTTFEIGHLNGNFTASLSAGAHASAYRYHEGTKLKKVGTGEMVFGEIEYPCWVTYEMNGGVLKFANHDILKYYDRNGDIRYSTFTFTGGTVAFDPVVCADIDISPYIKNSTGAISVSNDTELVWSSVLASSNTGGFTKKGSGTLTLSQPPAYTGTTTVEGGVLYIVEGYSPTLAAGTVEMVSDKTGYKKYVPAAAAVAHVGNLYYPTFAEAWAAAGNGDNAAWIHLDSELAQNDIVTLDTAWQRVRVANGTYSADGHIAISGSLANVALKTSLGAEMTEYTAYPTVTVAVVPGAGVASGEIAAGYISKDGATYTIYSGSEVTITWTAAEGYEFAGGQSTATTVISPTENVTPECPAATAVVVGSVSIAAPEVGAYGNDFDTVSVTAGVTSTYPAATTITYTLKANGTAIATTTAAGDATSVTFGNANVSSLARYGNISYTVEASGDNVTAATSGATTAMLADSKGWVDEKKSTTGTTGSWKTADGAAATVTYDNETERAELSDNKFSANNCSTGDVVTVTIKDVIYTALSDTSTVDGDAQGSIALGGTESAPTFMVLTKSGNEVQWSVAAGVDPALNTSYTIVFTFDYNNNTYSITVNGTALTVGGSSTYGIVKTDNKYVKDIDFLGAGSIKAIEGVQYDAMMAVDQNGDRYATVAEALDANKSVKGAIIKLLHGTANTNIAGWNYNADTKTFIKKAVGLIFLAL